uniref:Proteolipid protein 2 n=1 Tax=Callorhinchus milii TaxID=7868 RepID=V9LE72_CALMI
MSGAETPPAQSETVQSRFLHYVRTRRGTVILAEIVVSLIVLICFCVSAYTSYTVTAILEMIFSIVFFVIYMNRFDLTISFIHWPWTDMIRCVIAVILYVIVGIVSFIYRGDGARIAAGVFALIGAGCFGYDAFLILPSLQGGARHTPANTNVPSDYSP